MDGLRWLLLISGVLVVAAVYWYSRRESRRPPRPEKRREPSLDTSPEQAGPDEAGDPLPDPGPTIDDADAVPEKVVTLRMVAGNRGSMAGDDLVLALREAGMRHGKFGIFHHYHDEDEAQIIFSAASLVEPGSFDLANLNEQRLPGISLFLVLPGPIDGAEAFDAMMTTARELAAALNAELLDESGSTLSIQRERYLREEIIQYQLAFKVA
ncbi:MAG: cell division protein ZipA C-terminal FtsZ-binding domain-containing protein [Woeseia sp.]